MRWSGCSVLWANGKNPMNCDECKEQVFELIEREAVDPEAAVLVRPGRAVEALDEAPVAEGRGGAGAHRSAPARCVAAERAMLSPRSAAVRRTERDDATGRGG